MNLGRGFPVPQENGQFWISATPEKPVVQRPSYPQQPNTQQPNHTGQENWQDLLGIYTGLLQDVPDSRPPKKLNVNYVGPNYREYNIQDVVPVATHGDMSQNLVTNGFAENNHMEPSNRHAVISPHFNQNQIFSPNFHQAGVIPSDLYQNGVVSRNFHRNMVNLSNFQRNEASSSNFREHNIQNVGPVENFRRSNQNAGSVIPQKVTSLAELLGNMNSSQHVPLANGTPSRSAYIAEKLTTFHPLSQAQSSQSTNYESAGVVLHQRNLIMQANPNNGNYNLPQTANIRPSVTSRQSYNLNFPPISEAGESSSALKLLDQLWPATPDQQKQPKNNYQIQEQVAQVNEIQNQEKDSQGNCVISQQSEVVEISSNEFMQSASSVAIFANNLDGGNEIGIDLNDTPAQKTPKRKKHRPKVIVEGKPKRTPKPKNNTPNEKPIEKRKYVRRKGIETTNTPSTDIVKEPEVSLVESAAKSCKRSLNFDLENKTVKAKRKYVRRKGIETLTTPSTDVAKEPDVSKVEYAAKSCRRSLNFDLENKSEKVSGCKDFDCRAQGNEGKKMSFDLNLDSNPTEWSAEIDEPPTFAPKGQQDKYNEEKQQADLEQISEESVPVTTLTAAPNNHALNVIARTLSFRNANMNQSGIENRYDRSHHHLGGGHAQIVTQTSNDEPNIDGRRQSMISSKPQLLESSMNQSGIGNRYDRSHHHLGGGHGQIVTQTSNGEPNIDERRQSIISSKPQLLESSMNIIEKQGSQRNNSLLEVVPSQSVTLMGSALWSNGISKKRDCTGHSIPSLQHCSESINKSRAEDKFHGTSSRVIPEITNKSRTQSSQAQSYTSTDLVAFLTSADLRFKFQQERTSSQVHQRAERFGQKKTHIPTCTQGYVSVPTTANCNQQSAYGNHLKFTRGKEVLNSPITVPVKGQAEQKSLSEITILDKVPEKEITNSRSKKIKGLSGRKKKICTVDDIEDLLKDLTLDNTGKEISQAEQNALVPYRGYGGIVPFDPIKKRLPRPRVDLDPETNRLWNLLMGKEASESAETVDTDKQKWWEEERKVFRGRVDSFIARMHLVQGDRRFSKWKGSVVDSVIGVFLTQNVSDHLSSSAFMSLAAKFPLKSRSNEPECSQNGKSQSAERYQVRVTYPEESRPENGTQRTHSHLDDNIRTEEDIISSQSSSESFVYQASEDIRSSSGSNSENEDQLMRRNFNLNHAPVSHAEQAKRTAALHQHQFHAIGMDKRPFTDHLPSGNPSYGQYLGADGASNANFHPFTHNTSSVIPPTRPWLSMLMGPEECTSSLTSLDFGSTIENQFGESIYMSQVEKQKIQASFTHRGSVNKYNGQQTSSSSQAALQGISAQHFINSRQESFQTERTFTGPTKPAEASSKQSSGNHKYPGLHFDNQASIFAHNLEKSEGVTPRPSEMGQAHASGGPSDKIGNAIPNGRKRKAEKEKVEPFKWDVLREQVEKKNGPYRGVNVNAMDSLDYEALRNADVGVISDAIKERGMNNMLAERMKDFLNRIVRDHGKVDLEWLRDVQPDKAKDYLLSIRGLGLKSVECVRLLTLHHLAFPVDTNVGRIAVRLGWVPLQPLPESLQLHLLEMYPILESIQKFLWPRLCKLDQETLYELHYQMITFGKVFCTKRDPNCNACPMRGECRHFASAFASARLALPGPEEKRIVPSADPITAKKGFDVNIRPVPLLQDGYNFEGEREMGLHNPRSYEPIIEEPSTPEAPVEVLERDIEDAFYEDPDEIPVIKLNLEEFTTNLQNFIQENMEMQDGEMSRALVALDPELASIPTPKLKHVSRLRTEHQVYELPDSHPLLKGMDRREPDDPSPYMLAMWTPGETADSVQPPESKCSSQGGPCNLSTCFACNSTREAHSQTVRGTILIPCRTAMRGSFPLNGTYFQVNELFADHESSLNPIDVPRSLIWNLPRRTVFFGTSTTSIFKGLSTQDIQFAFWKGFVCVRGFDREHRAPRPLRARLHFTASKMKQQTEEKKRTDAKKA